MTEQEQIEKWREEFISINRTKRDTSFFNGRFLDDRTEILFHGFLMAKRNMPVVELPSPFYIAIKSGGEYLFFGKEDTLFQLTSKGIKYTIKGE
jgi:thiamine pyrophosphokinase